LFWTDELLEAGAARLAAWREAAPYVAAEAVPALADAVRRALSEDLDAPAALAAVDAFARAARAGSDAGDGAKAFAEVVDALLGIRL